jgi:hypothetical protein
MEKVKQLLLKAKEKINTADHLIYVTYPQVKEVRMLYGITENLALAIKTIVQGVVEYEKMYKRLPYTPSNFAIEFEMFKTKCAKRYRFTDDEIEIVRQINSIVEMRKKSPMEFVRRDKFIICTENYKMKIVNLPMVKQYLNVAKSLFNKTIRMIK